MTERPPRKLAAEVEVQASPEEVWRCVSEANEIMKWFAPRAKVEPGVGGEFALSWGDSWDAVGKIEAWEPSRRLRVHHQRPDFPAPDGEGPDQKVSLWVDYEIEAKDSSTVLRVVQSGFGSGNRWDEEVQGTQRGWKLYLQTIRNYLENYQGRECANVFVTRPTRHSESDSWARLTSPDGPLFIEAGVGSCFEFKGEDALQGAVDIFEAPQDFGGILRNGCLRIGFKNYQGNFAGEVLLLTYNDSTPDRDAVKGLADRVLDAVCEAPDA